jgi:hypothetical protein
VRRKRTYRNIHRTASTRMTSSAQVTIAPPTGPRNPRKNLSRVRMPSPDDGCWLTPAFRWD